MKLEGVTEYAEGFPVEIIERETAGGNGRIVIAATNEGGYSGTEIDLLQLIDWIKTNRPDLLVQRVNACRQKTLWMTVGLPRSGKTTFARGMKMPIVNPDSIRLALHGQRFIGESEPMVWAIAKYMVVALFEAGHNGVVLDATNTTVKRREEWADKRWVRKMVVMPTTKETCIERAKALNDAYILPIIEKMAAQFEPYDWSIENAVWERGEAE